MSRRTRRYEEKEKLKILHLFYCALSVEKSVSITSCYVLPRHILPAQSAKVTRESDAGSEELNITLPAVLTAAAAVARFHLQVCSPVRIYRTRARPAAAAASFSIEKNGLRGDR